MKTEASTFYRLERGCYVRQPSGRMRLKWHAYMCRIKSLKQAKQDLKEAKYVPPNQKYRFRIIRVREVLVHHIVVPG